MPWLLFCYDSICCNAMQCHAMPCLVQDVKIFDNKSAIDLGENPQQYSSRGRWISYPFFPVFIQTLDDTPRESKSVNNSDKGASRVLAAIAWSAIAARADVGAASRHRLFRAANCPPNQF
ncbi:MAG: hypothetical protein Q8O38_05615 [Sulfurimicrobium sp.]|nr:hypothetical protein [Sulfurimicrobium sp.]